ncbi:MAG TPA: tagaturonate reductase [Longimicrobium sp.]|jgi:tagaturonate reductase
MSAPTSTETPRLDRALVTDAGFAAGSEVVAPAAELLALPERAVQFGTGAFLRGFVDYFLDRANREGHFGGRVVMVGSTGSGRDSVLNDQDGLYTLAIQGMTDGEPRQEHRVIGSVSRALSAVGEWDEVLACARNPELELVFSNTTEVGIALDESDEAEAAPPRSFPGKLTRFLYERGRAFDYAPERGVVVIPCELIEDNGARLREIVLALAARWELGDDFARWITSSVPFCDTLVDRIVPGAPGGEAGERLRASLGYRDELLTACEPYRLFAIRGDDTLRARIRFADADPAIVVTDDVGPYRERKVRLLNGTHSIMVPAAILAGCEIVSEAVEDEVVGRFIRRVMTDEIVPSLDAPGAAEFARETLDRFANPYIRHALADITLQQTMKLRVRVVPSIVSFTARTGHAPKLLALGFAGYLLFMHPDTTAERKTDDAGERVTAHWAGADDAEAARRILADTTLWGMDLTAVPGFADEVTRHLARIREVGMRAALETA